MSEWSNMTFNDIAEFNPRESIKKGEITVKIGMDKLQPFCRDIAEVEYEEFSGGTKFRNNDTIMARITPCLENGKTAMVSVLADGQVGFGSTEYIVFRAKNGISDPHFLYYLVCSPAVREPAIKSMVGSSGRQRVQTDVVQNLEFLIPTLDEQKKIGEFLKKLDDKIAVNNKINRNLSEQMRLVFKSWFIDFEPFGGELPSEWEVLKFEDFITLRNEKSNDASIPMYAVTDTGIYPRDEKFKKNLSKAGSTFKVVRKANLVFGMSREILNWGILNDEIAGVSSAYTVYDIDSNINSLYLEYYIKLRTEYFRDIIRLASREGQGVDRGVLLKKELYVPNKEWMNKFNELSKALLDKIQEVNAENERLKPIRDSLLPKLMSGELDVSDLDI